MYIIVDDILNMDLVTHCNKVIQVATTTEIFSFGYYGETEIYIPKIKWDSKAFFQLTLHQCRQLRNEYVKLPLVVFKFYLRTTKPRRKYNVGVRYAMCSTRVI